MRIEPKPEPTLRDRKKQRTHRTIRVEALRLFHEHGYSETTVEQIAAAADIAPSTFFRYFPAKEDVLLADDLDPLMIEAVRAQPPDLPILDAFRRAAAKVIAGLDAEARESVRQRQDLLCNVPQLRGALARDLDRSIDLVAELIAYRTGARADEPETRALAGAMIGSIWAVMDRRDSAPESLLRAVEFLSEGD